MGFDAERFKSPKNIDFARFSRILSNRTGAEKVLKCDFSIKFGTQPFKKSLIMITISGNA